MTEPSPLSELTERQRSFVEAYFALGGGHGAQKKAALAAGYSQESASQEASRLLRHPKVIAALGHLVDTVLDAGGTLTAARTLADASAGFVRRRAWDDTTQDVARDSDGNVIEMHQPVDPEMQIKSSIELLKMRGRFIEKTQKVQVDHNHTHKIEAPKMLDRLGELLAKMGKKPEDILPAGVTQALPAPIDVPFEEVPHSASETMSEECIQNSDKRAARAQQFEDVRTAHRSMEEDEIRRNARADARRERQFTEDDLEKEEWE